MKRLYICLIALLMAPGLDPAQAQGPVIPDFSIDSPDLAIDGAPTGIASTVSRTGDMLSWTQYHDGGTLSTGFSITGTSGSWDRASATGTVTMALHSPSASGTLTLTGDSNGMGLTLSITGDGTPGPLLFTVSSIVYP